MRHLVLPAVIAAGYTPLSALDLHKPAGMIGTEIIQRLYDAPLVIADLTGRNPNVYYELAVRHGYKKPVVQIVDRESWPLPFDIQTTRTVIYDTSDWDSIPACREMIEKQIASVEKDATEVDNPIVQGFNLQSLRDSPRTEDNTMALVLQEISSIRTQVAQLASVSREPLRSRFGLFGSEADRRSGYGVVGGPFIGGGATLDFGAPIAGGVEVVTNEDGSIVLKPKRQNPRPKLPPEDKKPRNDE